MNDIYPQFLIHGDEDHWMAQFIFDEYDSTNNIRTCVPSLYEDVDTINLGDTSLHDREVMLILEQYISIMIRKVQRYGYSSKRRI